MSKVETSLAHEARKPTDADRFVGQRLRQGRRELGLTQDGLASQLGLTFQQIQKYEAGHSRMSAGRLMDIAVALNKPVAWFYEPFEIAASPDTARSRDLEAHDLKRDARRLIDNLDDVASLHALVHVLRALVQKPL